MQPPLRKNPRASIKRKSQAKIRPRTPAIKGGKWNKYRALSTSLPRSLDPNFYGICRISELLIPVRCVRFLRGILLITFLKICGPVLGGRPELLIIPRRPPLSQRPSGYARRPYDFYATPSWCTAALIPLLPRIPKLVWEPAAAAATEQYNAPILGPLGH
jgi:hypothetical protein